MKDDLPNLGYLVHNTILHLSFLAGLSQKSQSIYLAHSILGPILHFRAKSLSDVLDTDVFEFPWGFRGFSLCIQPIAIRSTKIWHCTTSSGFLHLLDLDIANPRSRLQHVLTWYAFASCSRIAQYRCQIRVILNICPVQVCVCARRHARTWRACVHACVYLRVCSSRARKRKFIAQRKSGRSFREAESKIAWPNRKNRTMCCNASS